MRLATFIPPGATPRAGRGPRRGGGRASRTGRSVRERLAAGDPTPADGERWPARRRAAARAGPAPGAIFGIGLQLRRPRGRDRRRAAGGADRVHEGPPAPRAPPSGPVVRPPVVRRLDYEGELAVGDRRGRRGRRLRGRRRRQRPRPPAPRAAVDPGQGRRHVLPVGSVDHDARRRCRTRRRCASARGSTASCARTRAPRDLIFGIERLVAFLAETVHARAGRPHPHRDAERRRHGDGPAALPRPTATWCASRSRASARSSTRSWPRAPSTSVRRDDPVDEAVARGLVGGEEAVALHVRVDLLDRLAGVLGVDLVDAPARLEDLARVDLDVGRLALEARGRLVDEDAASWAAPSACPSPRRSAAASPSTWRSRSRWSARRA